MQNVVEMNDSNGQTGKPFEIKDEGICRISIDTSATNRWIMDTALEETGSFTQIDKIINEKNRNEKGEYQIKMCDIKELNKEINVHACMQSHA